jgi:hypothetical protein
MRHSVEYFAKMWSCGPSGTQSRHYRMIWTVNMPRLLKRMLAILVIVGLGVSPLYASAMKAMEQPATHESSIAAAMGDMPCHPKSSPDKSSPDKSSPDKICPFMVVCLSLCFQAMPPMADTIAVPAIIKLRTVFLHESQLASLTPSPPARPPRA